MRRAPASSAPWASPDYYERLGQLQQGLRDSEKKRLDLEKELYEYNQSDIYRVKLKYVKLKKYLNEIYESEKKAHTRNQEYLKRFERVQAYAGRFTPNTEKLEELKVACETQLRKKLLLSPDSPEARGALEDGDREKVSVQAGINSGTAESRGVCQPATVFTGRQVSAISSTEQSSPQPTENFPVPDPHSYRQTAQSSSVTVRGAVQTSSGTQSSIQPSELAGKAALELAEQQQAVCLETGSSPGGQSNASADRKPAGLHPSGGERLSPENRTADLKHDTCGSSEGSEEAMLTGEQIEGAGERAGAPAPAALASGHRAPEEKSSAWEGVSDYLALGDPQSERPFLKTQDDEEESSCSSSDLTVSVSEDDLMFGGPEPQPETDDGREGEEELAASRLVHTKQERDALATGKSNCVLQTLSWPDAKQESSANSPTRNPGPALDSGFLGARLGQHSTTLKEQNPPGEEAAASLSKALEEQDLCGPAACSEESSCSSPSSLHASGGIEEANPSLSLNGVHKREPEGSSSSGGEDEEEDLAAELPVTETEAYQLLKKAALRDHPGHTQERFPKARASTSQFSGLNIGSRTGTTKTAHTAASEASLSSSEGSPLSRHENKEKPIINLKSNAFWGESEDSNSEIEAALRPRNPDIPADDFDDFYD